MTCSKFKAIGYKEIKFIDFWLTWSLSMNIQLRSLDTVECYELSVQVGYFAPAADEYQHLEIEHKYKMGF